MDEQIDLNEVIAEMNELGRALFDAAHARVLLKRMQGRVAELENEKAGARPVKAADAA